MSDICQEIVVQVPVIHTKHRQDTHFDIPLINSKYSRRVPFLSGTVLIAQAFFNPMVHIGFPFLVSFPFGHVQDQQQIDF